MNKKKDEARTAGFLYLLIAITGGFGIMYTPTAILVSGDAMATANNLLGSQFTFRLSMFSSLVSQVFSILLVLTLARLFEGVHETLTKIMVVMVLVAVPISFLNVLHLVAADLLIGGANYLDVFEKAQLQSLGVLSLNLYQYGIAVVGVFWGLWLLPFGLLVVKSEFIPKIIGVFLIIACVAYLIDSSITILWPQHKESAASFLMLPLAIGEFSAILWLLIKGVKTDSVNTPIDVH